MFSVSTLFQVTPVTRAAQPRLFRHGADLRRRRGRRARTCALPRGARGARATVRPLRACARGRRTARARGDLHGRLPTTHAIRDLNGEPAIVTYLFGQIFAVTAFDTDGTHILATFRVL